MTHALETVVIAFPREHAEAVNRELDRLGQLDGAPFAAVQGALGHSAFVHFMSLVVAPALEEESQAHLVLELCADGGEESPLVRLAGAIPGVLRSVLGKMGMSPPPVNQLGAFLEERRVSFGTGLLQEAGLVFVGTPGMTVTRIRNEARLAARVREILGDPACTGTALRKLEFVRNEVFGDDALKWAFVSEPMPPPGEVKPLLRHTLALLGAAIRDLYRSFIVFIPLPALVFVHARLIDDRDLDVAALRFIVAMCLELVLFPVVLVAVAVAGLVALRRQENADVPLDVEPRRAHMDEIVESENRPGWAQNHLAGISRLKRGWVRYFTLRFALWLIAEIIPRRSQTGYIDKIGTIHFARWFMLPGTDRLVFLSNYDGSWQSYLEDFIARLREGLSSVWSNTLNFPKTRNLFQYGASDGARFKRWARWQQQLTRFWYSAYPDLTADRIRTNAQIRHGFASALTEDEAAGWLSRIGYAPREVLETAEIPSLVFGGLSPLKFAHCLIVGFGTEVDARSWVRSVRDDIAYGDRVPGRTALVVAFTSEGLGTLGLDEESMATFPMAFQQGMPARRRGLGDEPEGWDWGAKEGTDALLMVYADSKEELRRQVEARKAELAACGHAAREVKLDELHSPMVEPFGFRDGISQPVMRGSLRWSREGESINTVAPGEIVLGYSDGLDIVPPTPEFKGRDIGRNGTFLVVRQLEQDTDGFRKYVEGMAKALGGSLPDPRVPHLDHHDLALWIEAKIMGRWRNGNSLVRNPHKPGPGVRNPDNDFQYGLEDPHGLRCPLGAHVRRANPRDSFEPGSRMQIGITNRHRILRVGRNYESGGKDGKARGLLFMCLNADIERQFEFLQQTWVHGREFHGLDDEIDPVAGYRHQGCTMTIPTLHGPLRLQGLAKFVTVRGGGYFFMPARSTLQMLGDERTMSGSRPADST